MAGSKVMQQSFLILPQLIRMHGLYQIELGSLQHSENQAIFKILTIDYPVEYGIMLLLTCIFCYE
jgi:hypothetical protein